jgi:uncharacterized protein YecE (DUF72 family)
MTTKRIPIRRDVRARVTPELVALWRQLKEITEAGAHEEFEPVGRRNEFLEALHAMDRAFGIRPWQESPLYAETPEPPAYMRRSEPAMEGWRRAWELRCALEAASA